MTNPRPHGPATSATTTALNQSVLLGGNSAGQGQMYLRVSKKDHTYCQFYKKYCEIENSIVRIALTSY